MMGFQRVTRISLFYAASTCKAAGGDAVFHPRGSTEVKGGKEPVEAFELLAMSAEGDGRA